MGNNVDRTERVAASVKRELAAVMHQELSDARLNMLTISAVKMSRDLRYAKVYFTHIGDNISHDAATNILNDAAGFFRTRLAKKLRMKAVPALTFVYDTTLITAERIRKLLDEEE